MKRRLRAWLVPTFVAPWATTALLVLVSELSGAAGLLGTARLLALLAVDWLLLMFRRRIPPTGRRAWLSGAIAPLPAYGLWLVFRPPLLSAPSTHALAVAGALVAAAVAVRLFTSPRNGRGMRFS